MSPLDKLKYCINNMPDLDFYPLSRGGFLPKYLLKYVGYDWLTLNTELAKETIKEEADKRAKFKLN